MWRAPRAGLRDLDMYVDIWQHVAQIIIHRTKSKLYELLLQVLCSHMRSTIKKNMRRNKTSSSLPSDVGRRQMAGDNDVGYSCRLAMPETTAAAIRGFGGTATENDHKGASCPRKRLAAIEGARHCCVYLIRETNGKGCYLWTVFYLNSDVLFIHG